MWTQLPPEKRAHPPHPIFGPCLLWPNGWMDEDAAWYGNRPRPRPRPHCIRRGFQLPRKGHSSLPPLCRPMSVVAKRSPISAAAAELLSCHCLSRHLVFLLWLPAGREALANERCAWPSTRAGCSAGCCGRERLATVTKERRLRRPHEPALRDRACISSPAD